jgi:hypothetical protein
MYEPTISHLILKMSYSTSCKFCEAAYLRAKKPTSTPECRQPDEVSALLRWGAFANQVEPIIEKVLRGKHQFALLCGATPAVGEGFEGYFWEDKLSSQLRLCFDDIRLAPRNWKGRMWRKWGAGPTRNPRSTYLSR